MEEVKVWEEQVIIPTYEVGEPDKNPMFLEKRVYQGSSGKIYPYPTTEKISQEKRDIAWNAVYLENEYIKVMILPQLGGRIQRAYDKTNDYDFVYYNHVIKPALVGLTGPWISGGIEFNWPQHHRPTTYMPVDYKLQGNGDGSKSILMHDVDQMYGTKGITTISLYPGRAYIEIKGQLYNPTALPQTFLWWANLAVSVNDNTQSVFPPDVHSVMDHGKRDVSRFPIAKGIYYKHDYSEGVDISRYKNIPVPTSYMAERSEYDFVGGYDYGKKAGLLHVADHHISPGKKQWTWGNGEFGRAWDKNLTDGDGPYIELMTGVYTENQPDFTWLKPFEEKTFTQYFMPYKKAGQVQNATIHAALHEELTKEGIKLCVYVTQCYDDAVIQVMHQGLEVYREEVNLSPVDIYEKTIPIKAEKESDIRVAVYAGQKQLVSYQAKETGIPTLAKPAEPALPPEEIRTNEELLLTGQHIEQHRHATFLPDPYYLEGLKRDKGDIRLNNAYGMLLLRRGCFAEAQAYFEHAIARLTWRSPNPYDSEPYYNLGLSFFYQDRFPEAFDAFYKATWTSAQQEMSFYYLAVIQMQRGEYEDALALVEKSLIKNQHNIKARGMKAVLLRKLGYEEKAREWITENLKADAFDYVSCFEKLWLTEKKEEEQIRLNSFMRQFPEHYLQTARDYAEAGCYQEAITVLQQCKTAYPLLAYYQAYYLGKLGRIQQAEEMCRKADALCPDYCFPNKWQDIPVLEYAMTQYPQGAKAYYYLGNLYYDKQQFTKAISLWESSVSIDSTFPTVHRNLALAYYNKEKNPQKAKGELEEAFSLDTTDARVFLELDQLYKKLGVDLTKRLEYYQEHGDLAKQRDDAMLELVTLYNLSGMYEKAYETIMSQQFRPWEGAEGRISGQYKIALVEMAKEAMQTGENEKALSLLEKALVYPENLGEGRLEGTKDNHIYYYLGIVNKRLAKYKEAELCFLKATEGDNEPAGVMYYYDQPADMILFKGLANQMLGNKKEACACFNKLMDYGERHLYDKIKPDFFAVSLPDFLIFDEDMDLKNRAHCHYLMGLANLGLGKWEEAKAQFQQVMEMDYNHQNSRIFLSLLTKESIRSTILSM